MNPPELILKFASMVGKQSRQAEAFTLLPEGAAASTAKHKVSGGGDAENGRANDALARPFQRQCRELHLHPPAKARIPYTIACPSIQMTPVGDDRL